MTTNVMPQNDYIMPQNGNIMPQNDDKGNATKWQYNATK
jgi:hypothetical protein